MTMSKESTKMEELMYQLPRIFDVGEKKLNFTISNSGEFQDNIFREIDANRLVDLFIGRSNRQQPKHKRYFSSADVVYAGDLYKCGSWFKTWKCRYFVLRKDIRSLCYFESKDNLKLLGTVPLGPNAHIFAVRPEDADNYKHVLEIQPWGPEDPNHTRIRIRGSSAADIRKWENEIVSEATRTKEIPSDNNGDWWINIFNKIPEVIPISTSIRRQNVVTPTSHPLRPPELTRSNSTETTPDPKTIQILKENNNIQEESLPAATLAIEDADETHESTVKPFQDENTDDEEDDGSRKGSSSNEEGISSNIAASLLLSDTVSLVMEDKPSNPIDTSTDQSMISTNKSFTQTRTASPNKNPLTDSNNSVVEVERSIRTAFSRLSQIDQKQVLKLHSGAEEELAAIRKFAIANRALLLNKKVKKAFFETLAFKSSSPPPFRNPRINRFEDSRKLVGFQLSVTLQNICGCQDRIFAAVFCKGSLKDDAFSSSMNGGNKWIQASNTEIVTIKEKPAYGSSYIDNVRVDFSLLQEPLPAGSKLVLVAIYRCDSSEASDYMSRIKDHSTGGSSDAYALSPEESGYRSSNSQRLKPIAKVVIHIKNWNSEAIFTSKMKVLFDTPIDLSSPMAVEPKAILGVIKFTSGTLLQHRTKIAEGLNVSPYAEMVYSFQTIDGQTLSLEQLYSSKYSLAVPEAMIKFVQLDRGSSISKLCMTAHKDLESLNAEITKLLNQSHSPNAPASNSSSSSQNIKLSSSPTPTSHMPQPQTIARHSISYLTNIENFSNSASLEKQYMTSLLLGRELLEHAAELITDVQIDFQNSFVMVTENCQYCRSNVEPVEEGRYAVSSSDFIHEEDDGSNILRKSVWKKHPQWQFSTTNLNIHLMLSRYFSVEEIIQTSSDLTGSSPSNGKKIKSRNNADTIHVAPTITFGCPAAHSLRFKEGGLRRILEEISDESSRLLWIHMLQADIPSSDFFRFMDERPKESASLFHTKIPQIVLQLTTWQLDVINGVYSTSQTSSSHGSSNTRTNILKEIYTTQRKMELANRIDIVSSQILAFALTQVKTIIMLATNIGGVYTEILQRSLKIGFLLGIESLLSTYRDELGMIEDLDIAVQWLSLVTLRLISLTRNETNKLNQGIPEDNKRKSNGGMEDKIAVGSSDGVTIRRDNNGRIIVDLEILPDEVDTVRQCVAYMADYINEAPDMPKHSMRIDPNESKAQKYLAALVFDPHPEVSYADHELEPEVHAVTQLFGVMFTQGINEMQSLAILTQSRDLYRQADINSFYIKRIEIYYRKYVNILRFQLKKAFLELPQKPSLETSDATLSRHASTKTIPTEKVGRTLSLNLSKPTSTVSSDAFGVSSNTVEYGLFSSSPLNETERYLELIFAKTIQSVTKLFEDARDTVHKSAENPMDKHVDLVLKMSALCRKLGGTIGILCKSGKDRTGSTFLVLHTARYDQALCRDGSNT